MPARFAITKSTAQGETMVTDICQWNPVTGEICHSIDEMTAMADEVLKLSDMRLLEMNTRVLEAESLEQYCTPEEWGKILSVIDVMCGRMSADLVKRRWQSALEETAELELGRLEALNSIKNNDECLNPILNTHVGAYHD